VLVGKRRSLRGRVTAILLWAAGITAAGLLAAWAGGRLGLWAWPPQPSSGFGVLLGLVGGGIVLFEMALLPRKWLRWLRLVRTKVWMRLHVWLGLACLPVILVHAGLGFGGPLPAVTLILFLLVTASGIWGLVMQQWLPEKLLDEAPAETIASQTGFVGEYHADEAARLIESLTNLPPEIDELVGANANGSARGAVGVAVVVGVRGQPVVTGQPAAELAAFRTDVLVPYLRGERPRSPLATRAEAERRFAQLREAMPEAALPAIDRLERLADLRRQWDYQLRLNRWLHNWLAVHLPLSIMMTGLMLVHAVRALKYW
jgi:hypothetical protein